MNKKLIIFLGLVLIIISACKKSKLSKLNDEFCDCANSPTTIVIDTITFTIPNIFTPNGDGTNDYWGIKNIEHAQNVRIEITDKSFFNKSKSIYVFEGTGLALGYRIWDGRKNDGETVSDGKYHYKITIDGNIITGYVCVFSNSDRKYSAEDFDCLKYCTPIFPYDPLLLY